MKLVSEVETREELDELKSVMEIFIVNDRIRTLAQAA